MFVSAKEFQRYINSDDDNASYYRIMAIALSTPNYLTYGGCSLKYHRRNHKVSLNAARKALARIKNSVVTREPTIRIPQGGSYSVVKWLRPWDAVPHLKRFEVPEGDYGIGVEVEYGFQTLDSARLIARTIKNWKYVALDFEGGMNGIETTFAPVLYSKLNKNSQCFRYLKLLQQNHNLLYNHDTRQMVGTHVNVSTHDNAFYGISQMNGILRDQLTFDEKFKYFGREPYSYLHGQGRFIEFKLFNSVAEPDRLRQYIDEAVELTKLLECANSGPMFSVDNVRAALERGYNKSLRNNSL